MYSFTENIVLEIPDVEEQLANVFSEAEKANKGLIVEIAALHEGLTNNNTFYSKEELENALESWISPYPKPVLTNHDPKAEPLGRVIAAKMDQEADGTPYIRLQLAVTDKAACEKIISQRYLTSSVGGKAEEATCSICGENWSNASTFSAPCKHVRGKVYKGKVAHLAMKGCTFKEISFVNMPADGRSGVREISDSNPEELSANSSEDDWVRSARVFTLSMDKEEVLEYTESEEATDVLSELKKKDASNQYMQMKGAFLNALASEISIDEEEDILSISETLSEELATKAATTEETEENEEVEEETETAEAVDDPRTGYKNERNSRVHRAEGQEKAHTADIDPERSTGAPLSRLSDETPSEVSEDVTSDETELNEQITGLESRIEEIENTNTSLLEENAKLKAALKRSLVERVVDTKITLGIMHTDHRAGAIEEHQDRSVSSLADSLKDLMQYGQIKVVPDYKDFPTVSESTETGMAVDVTNTKEIIEGATTETKKTIDPETFFTDALMGRRKL